MNLVGVVKKKNVRTTKRALSTANLDFTGKFVTLLV
jgi:hypothetical protein